MTGSADQGGRDHPPRPAFALSVGITGHRADALPPGALATIRERVAAALSLIEKEARSLHQQERGLFSDDAPHFSLVSPLASGADQIAAALAVQRGWTLQAVLPLHEAASTALEPETEAEISRLLSASPCQVELPGDPDDPIEAFVLAGRGTVAHCDLLIAVWDGLPARGRGGTAETIGLALTRGTPVLHVPIDPALLPQLLWSAFDPVVITVAEHRACVREPSPERIRTVLQALLLPPAADIERKIVQRYLTERDRSVRLRVEYPLLMMLAGVRRVSRKDVSAQPLVEAQLSDWQAFRDHCVGCHGVDAPLDFLELAYRWSDMLATHFAQVYRSSHVLNFLLAALGAWIGLSGLVLDANPLPLALAEFFVVMVVVVNTLTGSRRCWHQRWLDYRQLAERLRSMRSLKLLAIAAPDPPGSPAEPVARRWIDWYAAAIWRSMGCPRGRLDPSSVPSLARAIAAHELRPQIAYHRSNADQMERLDHRLEIVALALFFITAAISLSVVVGLELRPDLVDRLGNWTTALSAGLPALGTAIFGIRVQGDHGAAAARSSNTAAQLQRVADEMEQAPDLARAADLTEQAGRVMLADLGEWRLVNELHELSLG